MYILGISCFYHDAAACLIKDGAVVAAAEEERFTRVKHDTRFPTNAINYCLSSQGITVRDLDYVGFYEKPMIKFERLMSQHIHMFPRSLGVFIESTPSWLSEKLKVPSIIQKKLGYEKDVLFIEHHMSHAASAYLCSPFKSAAILTVDGVGEWATTTFGIGIGNDVKILKEIHFPHSLGLLYSAVTAYLGFRVNDHEYKVMGLSAFGNPAYYDQIRKIIDLKEDGSYALDMSYFDYHYKGRMPSKKFIKVFGPARKRDDPISDRHKDIAASLQRVVEDVLFHMLNRLYKETGERNLCMAGGVALNSVANGKILRSTPFKDIFVPSAPGDSGGSMGIALYIYNTILGNARNYVFNSASFGPEYSTREVRGYLDSHSIAYRAFSDPEQLIKKTLDLILADKVVGWFQGRMEWGPRALGNRSILANPLNPDMKSILNEKVKHRETFRPFAPVVPAEDAHKFFDCDRHVPLPADFMLMVYPVKKKYRALIPAVTHVDGSGRLQTIRKHQNPLYYMLLKEMGKRTGIPILVNTSFNIRGEPIVCTPDDAYRCMMGTGIDYLVINKFLVARDENTKDAWDSEKSIKD